MGSPRDLHCRCFLPERDIVIYKRKNIGFAMLNWFAKSVIYHWTRKIKRKMLFF